MQTVCVHIARFILAHWKEIDGEPLMDCSDIDVEPQLKQMMRPLSIVLQIFPRWRKSNSENTCSNDRSM